MVKKAKHQSIQIENPICLENRKCTKQIKYVETGGHVCDEIVRNRQNEMEIYIEKSKMETSTDTQTKENGVKVG